jgi:hypothetical protein
MPDPPASGTSLDFGDRFERLGSQLGEREAAHVRDLDAAKACAEKLRVAVSTVFADFARASRAAGAPHLQVELGDIRVDDKHVRAVEFELIRGRHRAIVTAKSRGEVTFVGPFAQGKVEGPCRSFRFDADQEIHDALGDFLEQFLEEAATP